MKKTTIPRTDLQASTLALGTDYFGSTVDRATSMQLMDRYLEAGGNVIDTAELYARWVPGGEHQSEKTIGQWLRDRGVRDQIIVSTKGAHPHLESMDQPRLSKAEIQADLDGSLRRLGVERIDLYWLHRDGPDIPVEDILQILEDFRSAGKIRHAGFSNWTQARADAALRAAQAANIEGFVASQNLWTLATVNPAAADPTWASIDGPFAEWHAHHDFAAFPYFSQSNGYFRRLERGAMDQVPPDARVRVLHDNQENRDRHQRLRELQSKYGYSTGQIVLGYLTNRPFPVFPLVGPKNLADLEESLGSVEAVLSAKDVHYLECGDAQRMRRCVSLECAAIQATAKRLRFTR